MMEPIPAKMIGHLVGGHHIRTPYITALIKTTLVLKEFRYVALGFNTLMFIIVHSFTDLCVHHDSYLYA